MDGLSGFGETPNKAEGEQIPYPRGVMYNRPAAKVWTLSRFRRALRAAWWAFRDEMSPDSGW